MQVNQSDTCPYVAVIDWLERKAAMLEVDPEFVKVLSNPASQIRVHIPALMDDGRVELFEGIRVQHNNVLGPYLGGLRLHPSVSEGSMTVLATWRTMKNALIGVPFGGSQGGIILDPAQYSPKEIERIIRRFIYALGVNIGPEYDIVCPDVNTDSRMMSWILDTYLATLPPCERERNTHVVTGKPQHLGGIAAWDKAAGQAVVYAIEAWAAENGFDLQGATFVVEGFGRTGEWAARLLCQKGMKLVAVRDASGPIANPDGIDPERLSRHVAQNGRIAGFDDAQAIDHETLFGTKADIFITAALSNQINAQTAPLLNVRLVVEAADGTTDPEGDAIMRQRGIDLLPDIMCNTGSSLASYYEWLQNKRSERWDAEEIDTRLKRAISTAYGEVKAAMDRYEVDRRTASYISSLFKIEAIYSYRGFYP